MSRRRSARRGMGGRDLALQSRLPQEKVDLGFSYLSDRGRYFPLNKITQKRKILFFFWPKPLPANQPFEAISSSTPTSLAFPSLLPHLSAMSSNDVRSIMGLASTSGASTSTSHHKGTRVSTRKPEGISRELYALIGDNAPSLQAAQLEHQTLTFKERPKLKRKAVKW